MSVSVEQTVIELGLEIGPPVPPLGSYAGVSIAGGLVFTSGIVGLVAPDWDLLYPGRFGVDLTAEDGYASARAAMLSTLANVRGALGSLDAVERCVKVTGFVQTTSELVMGLPGLLNGATDLLAELFGEQDLPARSAIGVAALPGGASIELECVFALRAGESRAE